MKSLQNQNIWLTGASSGIGEALAYQLNQKGANLIISARRADELERVKRSCPNPERVKTLTLDLMEAELLMTKALEADSMWDDGIQILINNAGISQRDLIINTSIDVDRKIMEVDYFGTIALSKALLSKMIERGGGHHVVVSSAVGIISTPLRSSYAAAKHALHGFYDTLRAEHHDDNIKVTMVCPGFVRTNISLNAIMGDGSVQGKMDTAQANGMSPERLSTLMIKAVELEKQEVYIGGFKEKLGIYVKRFLPGVYSYMVRNMSVT